MNPNEQSRLIEIMAELLVEVQGMRQEQRETNQRLTETNQRLDETIQRLDGTNQRLDRLEKRTEQNTAAVGELRVSFVKLADKLEEFVDYGRRIQRLEDKVFIG